MQIHVNPTMLQWARQRAALTPDELAGKVSVSPDAVSQWEQTGDLTLAHLERLADRTYTPLGYLFLQQPPVETLPIPDFRTVDGEKIDHPSPNLLATLYLCERRQEWYRSFLVSEGEEPLPFVGTAKASDPAEGLATAIRNAIGLDLEARANLATWEEALRVMVQGVEDAGILVMRNGIVGNNTHRKLEVEEFRGFVLSDPYAPLIFINATDSRAAQMFTLAHELVHIWLGQSGLSDVRIGSLNPVERYCNRVAAELLAPRSDFLKRWNPIADPADEIRRLARYYKLSIMAVLIRAYEAGKLSEEQFDQLYSAESGRGRLKSDTGGGDFYNTQRSRLGRRFGRAVIASALEGRVLYRDALDLLGLKKMETFHKLARAFEVTAA
jgi:Zn-dependent peptidase ImmA (M78 family)